MTLKEFNEKKEELLNEIFHYTGGYTKDELTKMVNELRPPNFPTCSTCKHMRKRTFLQACQNESSEIYEDSQDNEYIKSMGCVHHSDLE